MRGKCAKDLGALFAKKGEKGGGIKRTNIYLPNNWGRYTYLCVCVYANDHMVNRKRERETNNHMVK